MEHMVSIFMENSFLRRPMKYGLSHLTNGPGCCVPCGSDCEFYIVPPLKCVSDDDVLLCTSNAIAFSGRNLILPDDIRSFGEALECLRIVPYENYPGFVKLCFAFHMVYNWDLKKYDYIKLTESVGLIIVSGRILRNKLKRDTDDEYKGRKGVSAKLEGPAIKKKILNFIEDDVHCICCPKWPNEAKEWPTRKRHGEWPSPVMVLKVVRNGCHIVCAQHRDCRDDEFQFRYSFSLAEVILLRSWTPTQQLIYHMLRFFAKKELIQADCPKEKKVLCTYHLKTLMLWTCEQESATWWNSSSVVAICCKLLRKLLEWIEKRQCPSYFIPEANLFSGKIIDLKITTRITDNLKLFSNFASLNQWFVSNYLLRCYDDVIKDLIGEFRIWRLHTTYLRYKRQCQLWIFDDRFTEISCSYMPAIYKLSEEQILDEVKVCAHLYERGMMFRGRNFVVRSEIPFFHLDSVLLMLYAANTLSCKQMLNYTDFISDVLTIVLLGTTASVDWRRYHNFPKSYRERLQKSHSSFVIAQEHMGKLKTPGSDPEFQLMSRLSMEYLSKLYSSRDLSTNTIQRASVVYMAAICFATSQHQAAIDLCSTILQNEQPAVASQISQREEEPLNAGCLIFIDDVANCIGIIKLFQFIINKLRLDYRQYSLNLTFTPQVFAEYIMIQSAIRIPKQLRMNWGEIPAVSLIDSVFLKVAKRKMSNIGRCKSRLCVYRRNDKVKEVLDRVMGFSLNEEIIIRLLMECSLESIALLYQEISDLYGVQCCTVVNCYQALYMFKRCQFDNVLRLCDQILADPELEDHLNKLSRPQSMFRNMGPRLFAFPHVLALRPFSAYFDEDVQCLIGLQVLCHVFLPQCEDQLFKTFDACIGEYRRTRNPLDMTFLNTLIMNISVKYQYFIGRHFLARYLKLRCLMLCDQKSLSAIFKSCGKLKPRLPLEHVINRLLFWKLQKNFRD